MNYTCTTSVLILYYASLLVIGPGIFLNQVELVHKTIYLGMGLSQIAGMSQRNVKIIHSSQTCHKLRKSDF